MNRVGCVLMLVLLSPFKLFLWLKGVKDKLATENSGKSNVKGEPPIKMPCPKAR